MSEYFLRPKCLVYSRKFMLISMSFFQISKIRKFSPTCWYIGIIGLFWHFWTRKIEFRLFYIPILEIIFWYFYFFGILKKFSDIFGCNHKIEAMFLYIFHLGSFHIRVHIEYSSRGIPSWSSFRLLWCQLNLNWINDMGNHNISSKLRYPKLPQY